MKKKLTQHEAIFYRMYDAHRKAKASGTKLELIPVHGFMGEIFSEEVELWGYVSYEVGARISELYADHPGLFYREMMHGRTPGVKYYGYRIADTANPALIKDPKIRLLYDRCRKYWLAVEMRNRMEAGVL